METYQDLANWGAVWASFIWSAVAVFSIALTRSLVVWWLRQWVVWCNTAATMAGSSLSTCGERCWNFGMKIWWEEIRKMANCGCLDSKTPEVCAWNSASLWFPGTCCWCYLCHRFSDAAGMEQAGTHWAYVDCTSAIFDRWEIWSQVLGGGDAAALHVQQVCGCLPTVLRLRGGVENLRIC